MSVEWTEADQEAAIAEGWYLQHNPGRWCYVERAGNGTRSRRSLKPSRFESTLAAAAHVLHGASPTAAKALLLLVAHKLEHA